MYKLLLTFVVLISANTFAAPFTSNEGIAESDQMVRPLLPGMMVDNTCLQDLHKQTVCTDKLLSEKPTIMVVYRGGWCPYCNAQLNRLKKIEDKLTDMGYQLLAVSPDSNKSVNEQKKRQKLSYTLLTDNELALSKELGLAFFLDKKTEQKYRNRLGVEFADINGDTRVSLPVPAVYILDKKGMVHFQYVNPSFRTRLDEKVLLVAAEQALKVMK